MSLYIGPDDAGDKVLHITKGETDELDMKSGSLSNSVFHSSLPYLQWKEHAVTTSSWVYMGGQGSYNGNYLLITAPSSFIEDIGGSTKYYFATINGVLYSAGIQNTRSIMDWLNSTNVWNSVIIPSSTYNRTYLAAYGYPTIPTVKLYTLNIDSGGYVPTSGSTSSISIGDGAISVNGTDLSEFKFINASIVNEVDTVIQAASPLQLMNSSLVQGDISITTESNVVISEGDKILFSSASTYNYSLYSTTLTGSVPARSISLGAWSNYTFSETVATGFSVGDMLCISFKFIGLHSTFTGGNSGLFYYKVGGISQNISTSWLYGGYRSFTWLEGTADGTLLVKTFIYTFNAGGTGSKKAIDFKIQRFGQS